VKFRAPLIGLCIFMTIAVAATWMVYVTLRRDVAGSTTPYSAVFTDVYGLRPGDDVRIAGVRVGRIEGVELADNLAKVSFRVQADQHLYGDTLAAVTYQNILGQRYLGLSEGDTGSRNPLRAGSVIPVQQTTPSFDVGKLVNGFEPLFSLLNPKQADDLTNGVILSLQGDQASIPQLVDQTSTLTNTLAGHDQVLADLISSLTRVTANLAAQDGNLDRTLTQTGQAVAALDSRRPSLQSSMGSLAHVTGRLSTITDDLYPAIHQLITRQPGFTRHMVEIEPQLAFTGDNLPLMLKGLARIVGEGSYVNAYACDFNATAFFPGLNDVTTYIINAATPGNAHPRTSQNLAWHTQRCRKSDG
jgi:phospholipid/cholesterol/gamma-HCH transport system substrate-binding protein